MASGIARTSEYMTVTVVVLLAFSSMMSACSSTPPETTGSTARMPPPAPIAYTPPPVIHPAESAPPSQPVSYAPRQQACAPVPPRKFDRDVTGSIPRSGPSPRNPSQRDFVAHVIGPRETLYSISRQYHTRTADIAAVNRINPDSKLRYGEILVIPVAR